MRQAQALSRLTAMVVVLADPALGATASITSVIPDQAHQCIQLCAWHNYQGNLPAALGCADPYENGCYCPTATESVSKAGVAIERCVSSRCAAGDLAGDLASLRSIYAGYCRDAGYSQDAGALGYAAAEPTAGGGGASSSSSPGGPTTGQRTDPGRPSKTPAGQGASATTTQKTTVTQTKASGADGAGSQVVVHETETVPVDGPRGGGSGPSAAVKIGVGVAVPVVALLLTAGIGLLLRRKRRAAGRGKLDGVAMEERGGGQGPGAAARDEGAGDAAREQQRSGRAGLAVTAGATVHRTHEVGGGRRSASCRTQAAAGSRRSESDAGHGIHEVMGAQRSGFYEADSGSSTRLFEVPGVPSWPVNELPASHKQMRHETLSGAG